MRNKNLTFSHYNHAFGEYMREEKRLHHGGIYSIGKRKCRRPLSTKKPIHLVLKSDVARGAMSLRTSKNYAKVSEIIKKYAVRFEQRVYKYSINANHIHIVVRTKTKKSFQDFLRVLAGLIARHVLVAERGSGKGKFWAALAFTRVSEWGKAFRSLKMYVVQNILEAAGVIEYRVRVRSLPG